MEKVNKRTKPYIYLMLIVFLVLVSSSMARFSVNKKFDGNINIKNHPCKTPIGEAAKYILDKEGGVGAIDRKPIPDFNKASNGNEGMLRTRDEYCNSYYYRGEANNWVYFADY